MEKNDYIITIKLFRYSELDKDLYFEELEMLNSGWDGTKVEVRKK